MPTAKAQVTPCGAHDLRHLVKTESQQAGRSIRAGQSLSIELRSLFKPRFGNTFNKFECMPTGSLRARRMQQGVPAYADSRDSQTLPCGRRPVI